MDSQRTDKEMLDSLLAATYLYFRDEVNAETGLTADKTQPHSPSSIAAVGMGLCAHIVAVERGLVGRASAVERTLKVLRFLQGSHQGPEPDASGYKGFYYHFLDMRTGRRAWNGHTCALAVRKSTSAGVWNPGHPSVKVVS